MNENRRNGSGFLMDKVCANTVFNDFLTKLKSLSEVKPKDAKRPSSSIHLKGLVGSSRAVATAKAVRGCGGIHLCIMNDPEAAAYFYNDVYHLLSEDGGKAVGESVLFYPSSFRRSSKYGREDSSNIVQRAAVLSRLSDASEEYSVVVTYPEAVAETVPKKSRIDSRTLKLATGEHLGMDFLREALHEYGFERHDFVYLPGQYSLRGGIIDVFSFSHNEPYRIEFFGDEIESIRVFDVNTQLSSDRKSSIRLIANIRRISEEVAESSAEISFLDYIPRSSVLWFDDPKATIASIRRLNDADRLPSAEDDAKPPNLVSEASFSEAIEGLTSVGFKSSNRDAESVFVFKTSPQPSFNKKFERLAGDISDFVSKGYLVSIVSENEKQIERLQNIFASVAKTSINFTSVDASVHEGFVDHSSLFCCYTDHQLFQRHHTYRIRGEVSRSNALTLQELNSLNNGDFIVHTDHGIGIFGGLVTTEVNGRMREMIRLTYRDNDVIFVGIQNLHRISKYRGSDGLAPTIHKPGSGVWNRLKQAAKRKIKDMAAELIKLYASRRATEGFAFSPDSYLQHELEASFVYDDTPDQLLATQAVKQDMERTYPMDRLVCGDVGFGKTEVAIRAAFKAATDGKQVAVLVPTTILALQHFKSFRSRLADFPITVDFVSRMRTSKENKRALDELQRGAVDVIIGTHRLLSKDVCFKDLGLLIIDEEQRFGVSSKEKLRQLRVNVDTLTLTATPIPRTLQFSVMGARDLSVINTPPPNRLPISTELHGFSEVIIAEAIDYETSRGGQVFFIHNRIKDIEDIERLIRRLCPKVRTVVAHGRMEGERLEEIMTDFVDGQYEVLIATTIIESGLDIPNANTIIINQAQNFGLSELHQLRGRVGRSNRKAFCYLLIPTYDAMTQEARRRLKAIEEFSDLGSGFNIAMQDLDIRGAGNLLGGEQSGFIAEIGFETYRRILDEAMLELREALPESEVRTKLPEHLADRYVTDCHVDTDVDACLPDDYITNKTEKLRLYRELDEIESDIELQQFRERLIDRFGPIPSQAEELFEGLRLRRAAIKLGFERIVMKNGLMFLYFTSNQQSSYYSGDTFARIIRYVQANPSKFKLKETLQRLSLTVRSVRTIGEALSVLNRWF